ncbi:MAG: winged helix DNA-binding protein [Chloroflexi bacterium]|nr:winged helix DNA-binding protein [Chloroflexota bacterium]
MLAKRSLIEIIHEILQMDGKRKTHIMYATALTYPQTTRYLDFLKERGLITDGKDDRGGQVFMATEKGQELSKHIDSVMEILRLGERDA